MAQRSAFDQQSSLHLILKADLIAVENRKMLPRSWVSKEVELEDAE